MNATYHQAAEHPPEMRYAHCIVGRPRTFVYSCVQDSILHNYIRSFGNSTTFIYFALPDENTTWDEKAFSEATMDVVLRSIERFRGLANVAQARVILDDEIEPAALRMFIKSHDKLELGARFQMWKNIQGCYKMIVEHEQKVGRAFDFVTRIRPDAVFFKPWVPQLILPTMGNPLRSGQSRIIIPRGGLGCLKCSNDHLAVVPRESARQYFSDIADEYKKCENRRCAQIHSAAYAGGHWKSSGAGYIYVAVGLNFSAVHVPYTLTAKGKGVRLQCDRVALPENDLCQVKPHETRLPAKFCASNVTGDDWNDDESAAASSLAGARLVARGVGLRTACLRWHCH